MKALSEVKKRASSQTVYMYAYLITDTGLQFSRAFLTCRSSRPDYKVPYQSAVKTRAFSTADKTFVLSSQTVRAPVASPSNLLQVLPAAQCSNVWESHLQTMDIVPTANRPRPIAATCLNRYDLRNFGDIQCTCIGHFTYAVNSDKSPRANMCNQHCFLGTLVRPSCRLVIISGD